MATHFYQGGTTQSTPRAKALVPPKPQQIKEYLDRFVIGQDEAKKTLAVAVYNHYKRLLINNGKDKGTVPMGKSNVLLLGETGCGKTYLVQTIARMLDVPCYIQDCTKITASGYVGSDVEDCLAGLLRSCNYDMEKAKRGIIMLDEVDKIRKAESGVSITRDVSGECVQQSLLKIVDGDVVGVPPMGGRKHPEQSLLYLDTTNILFIASGAFVGIDKMVEQRTGCKHGCIGFGQQGAAAESRIKQSLLSQVTTTDLNKFGMIPEFIGRFPVITNVESLDSSALVRILTEPDNALTRQYQELLAMDDVKLEYEPSALQAIADLSTAMHTGARGLRGIMERIMRDIMFDAPSMRKPTGGEKTVTITPEMVDRCSTAMQYAG